MKSPSIMESAKYDQSDEMPCGGGISREKSSGFVSTKPMGEFVSSTHLA
jgi:hypothetical protein